MARSQIHLGNAPMSPIVKSMTDADVAALEQLLVTPLPPRLGPERRDGTLTEVELRSAFRGIVVQAPMPQSSTDVILALILLWHDHLEVAHTIAQGIHDTDGSFVHAIMHRREPDAANSNYWWKRMGRHAAFPALAVQVDQWSRQRGEVELAGELMPGGRWEPERFVDACDVARRLPVNNSRHQRLREIQGIESVVLLQHLTRKHS